MEYMVYYSDVFGREAYDEVVASSAGEAIEMMRKYYADGLYIPKIIAVEKQMCIK